MNVQFNDTTEVHEVIKHEKHIVLAPGREAKLVILADVHTHMPLMTLDLEFLIRDQEDRTFRLPIGKNHPKYWKLQGMSAEKAKFMQLEYSGISRRQINETLREFESMYPEMQFRYKTGILTRLRYLKGIRVTAKVRHDAIAAYAA